MIVKDKHFELLINHEQILKRTLELSEKINCDYANKNPLFISILNGSFMFTADLLKNIYLPCELSFIKLKSYTGMESNGSVDILSQIDIDVKEKDILFLEDIVDTGNTIHFLRDFFEKQNPKSIKTVSLLIKPNALKHSIKIDYCGFEIENKFVVGYGLDYDGLGRNLKDIYQLAE